MKFIETKFKDALLIEPEPVRDPRGFFARTFCANAFAERGMENAFVQHSRSQSQVKGTVRGMHFQMTPHEEVKLVTCVRGAMFDVIIDLRPESKTYRQWQSFELTQDNRLEVYIPKGFAHGFQTLSDDVETNYLISNFYVANSSTGVPYNDPAIGIVWPLPVSVISERDKSWARLDS